VTGRRWLILVCLALLALAAPVAARGDDEENGSRQNVATAIVLDDGGKAFDAAWSLSRQEGGPVDHRNEAIARASCTDCRAVAIAFQIVIAFDPSSLVPFNRAEAVNANCERCLAFAAARQFVRITEQPAKLSPQGRAELADVRRDLRALRGDPSLDVAQLAAAVEAHEARVLEVLETQLVPARGGGSVRDIDRQDREDDDRGGGD
jgi:putative peptide zinc metalloprotease protein